MSFTQDEILKKLITRASDRLVLDVYARVQEDWRPWGIQWLWPEGLKSWAELTSEALTIEEAAFLLAETAADCDWKLASRPAPFA